MRLVDPYRFIFNSIDNANNTDASNRQAWLIIGDSTARGNTPQDAETSAPQTYANILYNWNQGAATIDLVGTDLLNATSGSPWVNFGMNYYYKTGYKPVFINLGNSGSCFSSGGGNSWNSGGTLYATINSPVGNCLSQMSISKLRGIIIQLGINDTNTATAMPTVTSDITSLPARLQVGYPGVPIYFVNIGKNASGVTSRVTDIRNHIDTMPGAFSGVYVINRLGNSPFTDNMYDADGIHHSQFMNALNGAMCIKNMFANSLIANTPPSLSYPTATQDVIGRFTSLPTAWQIHVNNFIKYIDDNGHYANIDSFYCPLMNNSANSIQDWKRSSKQAILNGGLAWSNGLLLDGVNDYVDLNFIPTVDGVNFALNDNTLGAMLMERVSAGTNSDLIGSIGANTNHRNMIFESSSSNNVQCFNNSGTVMTRSAYQMRSYFNYFSKRIASNSTQLTENATSLSTGSSASIAQSPATIVFGARNSNGVFSAFKNCGMGPVIMGKNSVGVTAVYRKIRELAANCLAELS